MHKVTWRVFKEKLTCACFSIVSVEKETIKVRLVRLHNQSSAVLTKWKVPRPEGRGCESPAP